MAAVFCKPERKLSADYVSPRGTLRVTGCYDALLFNPDKGEATLFEFKGYQRSEVTAPLSQGLLYAWLVQGATGILPALQVIYLGEEENGLDPFPPDSVRGMMVGLPGLFERALDVLTSQGPLPVAADKELCADCPFRDSCEGDWGAPGGETPSKVELPPEKAPESEAQERMAQLLAVLGDLRLPVTAEGFDIGPCFIRLKIRPDPKKATVAKILNRSDDLQVQMHLQTAPLIQAMGGYVGVDIPRAERQPLTLDELLQSYSSA